MCCNCFFCKDERFSLNRMLGLEAESSVIYEDKNVFVTPDIAPVVKGHYLIVTHEHINSYGNADEKKFASLEEAKKFLICNLYHTDNVLFSAGQKILCKRGNQADKERRITED